MARRIAALCAVCVAAGALVFLAGCPEGDVPPPPGRRSASPDGSRGGAALFDLPSVDGRMVRARGPAALYFFTTWCGFCKQALPEVRRMAAEARAKGWNVYGVDVQEAPADVARYLQEYDPGVPVLLDQSAGVAGRLGVRGYPTFVLIDARGAVVYIGHTVPGRIG